ncbi:hypothetical protein [Qipengyuania sp. MTN3-11]|uniref:hypothetical protein n=1 Tax=Qipengyuania sp. MTN3-11 TaxID=3056557 RepID=UPI0036F3E7EF
MSRELEERLRDSTARAEADDIAWPCEELIEAAGTLRRYREALKTIMDKTGDCDACWDILDTARQALEQNQ